MLHLHKQFVPDAETRVRLNLVLVPIVCAVHIQPTVHLQPVLLCNLASETNMEAMPVRQA